MTFGGITQNFGVTLWPMHSEVLAWLMACMTAQGRGIHVETRLFGYSGIVPSVGYAYPDDVGFGGRPVGCLM